MAGENAVSDLTVIETISKWMDERLEFVGDYIFDSTKPANYVEQGEGPNGGAQTEGAGEAENEDYHINGPFGGINIPAGDNLAKMFHNADLFGHDRDQANRTALAEDGVPGMLESDKGAKERGLGVFLGDVGTVLTGGSVENYRDSEIHHGYAQAQTESSSGSGDSGSSENTRIGTFTTAGGHTITTEVEDDGIYVYNLKGDEKAVNAGTMLGMTMVAEYSRVNDTLVNTESSVVSQKKDVQKQWNRVQLPIS